MYAAPIGDLCGRASAPNMHALVVKQAAWAASVGVEWTLMVREFGSEADAARHRLTAGLQEARGARQKAVSQLAAGSRMIFRWSRCSERDPLPLLLQGAWLPPSTTRIAPAALNL